MRTLIMKSGDNYAILPENFNLKVHCDFSGLVISFEDDFRKILFTTILYLSTEKLKKAKKLSRESKFTNFDNNITNYIATEICEYIQREMYYIDDDPIYRPFFDVDEYLIRWEEQLDHLLEIGYEGKNSSTVSVKPGYSR